MALKFFYKVLYKIVDLLVQYKAVRSCPECKNVYRNKNFPVYPLLSCHFALTSFESVNISIAV